MTAHPLLPTTTQPARGYFAQIPACAFIVLYCENFPSIGWLFYPAGYCCCVVHSLALQEKEGEVERDVDVAALLACFAITALLFSMIPLAVFCFNCVQKRAALRICKLASFPCTALPGQSKTGRKKKGEAAVLPSSWLCA